MTSLALDLLIVAVIVLFALRGRKKGFVLTLCGLLALLVAYAGAVFVSSTFTPQLAAAFQPAIEGKIDQVIQAGLDQVTASITQNPRSLPETIPDSIASKIPDEILENYGGTIPDEIAGQLPSSQISLTDALELFKQSDVLANLNGGVLQNLAENLYQHLTQAIQDNTVNAGAAAATAISGFLATQIAHFALFYLTFVVVLILWKILSQALDLACRLPVLRTFNEAGGLLLGVVKGAAILLALVWLLSILGLVSQETIQQTYLFRLFMKLQPQPM